MTNFSWVNVVSVDFLNLPGYRVILTICPTLSLLLGRNPDARRKYLANWCFHPWFRFAVSLPWAHCFGQGRVRAVIVSNDEARQLVDENGG